MTCHDLVTHIDTKARTQTFIFNFYCIEILNKFVGESEANIR